jgi:UDP-N-acetylmuramoylalanine--D-glutamate ligase
MLQLKDQHVLILGLGHSGLAMARWCVRCGARVTVADTRQAPPQLEALQAHVPQAQFVSGAFSAALLQGSDLRLVLRSPGLSPAALAPLLSAAQASATRFAGELDLFVQALADLRSQTGYAPKLLAVTGTNGKTTVTALTGQLLERAGKSMAVAGNIGPTMLDTLVQRLDAQTLPEVWVLELSSFQLHDVQDFEPGAATVLNLTQDHLDWHGSMDAYARAKARVFGRNALMLLNREDPRVMHMLVQLLRTRAGKPEQRTYQTFGADLPQRPGDFGIEVANDMAWLVRAYPVDETHHKRKPRSLLPAQGAADPGAGGAACGMSPLATQDAQEQQESHDTREALHLQRLMPAEALRIRGRHNALNALAALALAHATGAPLAPMLHGLRDYRGEPHRVQSLGIVNGVEYFDDSKGTNVGATAAALLGLGVQRPLVVILGGEGKGQDFTPLADPVTRHARAVILLGRDAPALRAALQDTGVAMHDAASLPEAVMLACQSARAGDAVLMSPACASFDMFDHYVHRAQVFREAVQALALDAGVTLEQAA